MQPVGLENPRQSKAVAPEEANGCLVDRVVTPSELYRRLLAAGAEEAGTRV